MLKITQLPDRQSAQLRLEGVLTGPWTEELRCQLQSATLPIQLDLSGITFMDAAAAELLQEYLAKGITITSASHFVSLMLQL